MLGTVKQKAQALDVCHILKFLVLKAGTRCSLVVKALCYKPEGRRFHTQ
jgi:hypothetical protein